jgi:hypothetical protein
MPQVMEVEIGYASFSEHFSECPLDFNRIKSFPIIVKDITSYTLKFKNLPQRTMSSIQTT